MIIEGSVANCYTTHTERQGEQFNVLQQIRKKRNL